MEKLGMSHRGPREQLKQVGKMWEYEQRPHGSCSIRISKPCAWTCRGSSSLQSEPPTMITAVVLHQIWNHLLAGPSFDRELP